MNDNEFVGQIYSVDDRHMSIALERQSDYERMLVEPDQWNWELFKSWLKNQATIHAVGLRAAGLPLLMRAQVKITTDELILTREEWDKYTDEERWTMANLLYERDKELRKLLSLIPDCSVHGDQCIPHAEDWIKARRQEQEGI